MKSAFFCAALRRGRSARAFGGGAIAFLLVGLAVPLSGQVPGVASDQLSGQVPSQVSGEASLKASGADSRFGSGAGSSPGSRDGDRRVRGVIERLHSSSEAAAGAAAGEETVPPELRANLIDKSRIAGETYERAVGLREKGNPHLPAGLLLSRVQEDVSRSRIPVERLRSERARIVEAGRDPVTPAVPGTVGAAGATATEARPAGSRSPKGEGGPRGKQLLISIILMGVFFVVGGIVLHRTKS